MEFKKFYQKYMRMCKSYENCEGCPRNGKGCLEFDMDMDAIEELENDVERWAEEHPQKTRLQDSAPPVGKCGECKYFNHFFNAVGHCMIHSQEKDSFGDGYRVEMLKTDFCSYFEPRED